MFAYLTEEEQREYIYRQGQSEGRAEGRAEGHTEGIFETLANLVRDKLLDITEAAKRANMTTEEFMAAANLK